MVRGIKQMCYTILYTDEAFDGAAFYTHLGTASSISTLRELFEKRSGFAGEAIRIEKVSSAN